MKPLLFSLLVFFALTAYAKPPVTVKMSVERSETPKTAETLILPYAFSTQDMGTAFGLGAMTKGTFQDQMTLGATAFTGESDGLAIGIWDYKLAGYERLFFSSMGMIGRYPLIRAYAPVPNDVIPSNHHRPGSNDSDVDDFFSSAGANNWWEIKLDYVLPIGAAKNKPMAHYKLTNGLLDSPASRVKPWNPLTTGTTIFTLRQFNRFQRYEKEDDIIEGKLHALELGVLYDNTDFPLNPSEGSSQYISLSFDPGWNSSVRSWTAIELEASKYFSLGASDYADQRILALNAWTAYSPSWDVEYNDQGDSKVINNPPFLEGATLGGLYRMRGFSQNRFHDKAVIYTTAEYRYTLKYNPIEDVTWLKFLKLDWFQLVPYIEGGRVAPDYAMDTLFSDWKLDAGLSVRAMTAGIILRLDIAKSNEGTNTWIMVAHPF